MSFNDPDPTSFVCVRATLPRLPLISARKSVVTERLVIRPLAPEDAQAYHVLRTQPDVMVRTAAGIPDKDLVETQAKLDLYLPPNDATTFNFAICLRKKEDDKHAEEGGAGEMIGAGGVHMWRGAFGWPELGYMIRTEHWGKGIVTEFVKGFLGVWAGLEREEREVLVDERFVVWVSEGGRGIEGTSKGNGEDDKVDGVGRRLAEEHLIAITQTDNVGSLKVLERSGFEFVFTWTTADSRAKTGEDGRERLENVQVELPVYRIFPGRIRS